MHASVAVPKLVSLQECILDIAHARDQSGGLLQRAPPFAVSRYNRRCGPTSDCVQRDWTDPSRSSLLSQRYRLPESI